MSLRSALNLRTRQQRRRDVAAFAALIAAPAVGSVTLPAGGSFAVKNSSELLTDTVALTIRGSDLSVPASAAGKLNRIDWISKGSVVTIAAGFTLLLDRGLGTYVPIGSG